MFYQLARGDPWLIHSPQDTFEAARMPGKTVNDILLHNLTALEVRKANHATSYMTQFLTYHRRRRINALMRLLCVSCPSAIEFSAILFLPNQAQILLDHFNVLDEL